MIKNLMAVCLLGLLVAGCGEKKNTQTVSGAIAPAAQEQVAKHKIGLIMKTLTNPFFLEMEKGARSAENELKIDLIVKAATQETSIEQQIQFVEDLTTSKVDAIVIAPGDSQTLIPALKKASDAGIKIVNIDNQLDPATVKAAGMSPIPFVSVDNEKAAYEVVKLISTATKPAEAIVLEGIKSAANGQQRVAGAKRAFAENKLIKVVASESANWKIDEAYTLSKTLFAKHPKVTLVFAANDMMALGVLQYLQEVKRTDVQVVGFDALNDAVAAVKAKTLVATVDQQAAEQGKMGIELAEKLIKGEKVDEMTLVAARNVTFNQAP